MGNESANNGENDPPPQCTTGRDGSSPNTDEFPERLPVTAAQRDVWIAQQLRPDTPIYNCGAFLDIHGPLDTELIGRSVTRAVADAETLRVRFAEGDDGPGQYVLAAGSVELPVVDLADDPDPDAAADTWMRRATSAPIDLAEGPPASHALLRLSPRRHLLFLRYHHIVLDGYGQALHLRRIAEVYTALADGREPRPSNARPLADLLAEDAAYQVSPRRTRDREYWAGVFAEPPAQGGPAAVATAAAGTEVCQYEDDLAEEQRAALLACARDTGTRWPTVLLAALAAYLRTVTGTDDLVLGMPVTARATGAALRTPAMLSNHLPLRLPVMPATTFAELVARTAERTGAMGKHQRYRGEDLHRDLGLAGRAEGYDRPTVNVLAFDRTLTLGPCRVTMRQLTKGVVRGLAVSVYGGTTGEDAIRLEFEAPAARYGPDGPRAHLERFRGHLGLLLAAPGDPIGSLAVPIPGEAPRPAGPVAPAPATTVARWFEHRARRHPHREAVSTPAGSLTYAELDVRADRLAAALAAGGAAPERCVAVLLPWSANLVVALLAVLKSGAAYLLLDPGHPADRLDRQIEDARPVLLLTDRDGSVAGAVPVLSPDDPGDRPVPVPLAHPHGETPACVVHTSGSTAAPKAVVGTHAALLARHAWYAAEFPFRDGETVLAHGSPAFVDTVNEVLGALLNGATVVPAEGGDQLVELLTRYRPSRMVSTPSLLGALLDDDPNLLASCSLWISSGEAMPPAFPAHLARVLPGARLVNLYGTTETAGDSLVAHCEKQAPGLGEPIAGTSVRLLDSALHPVPPGVPGELHVCGRGLARGYLNRPGLTAERFLADPYGPPGTRMYRTGDLARRREDGVLEYLGRADRQTQIRGVRVEPGGIEAVLGTHPDVRGCAVTNHPGPDGAPRLAAHVVTGPPGARLPSGLRDWLAERLPAHHVPDTVTAIDALPLLPSGKTDLAALAPPPPSRSSSRPAHDEEERTLCALFGTLLARQDVGAEESFFGLGGDSVLALRLAALARRAGFPVTVREVFEYRTAAGLAAACPRGRAT
nr:non-ribosomal peptide synthetase [Amycolatopsis antarctica]